VAAAALKTSAAHVTEHELQHHVLQKNALLARHKERPCLVNVAAATLKTGTAHAGEPVHLQVESKLL
jgi:hypothetical protein